MQITQGVNIELIKIAYMGDDIGNDLHFEFDGIPKVILNPNLGYRSYLPLYKLLHTTTGSVHLRIAVTEKDFTVNDLGSNSLHINEYGAHSLTVNVNETTQILGWSGWLPNLRRAVSHTQASFVCDLFASYASSGTAHNMPSFSNLEKHYPAYDQQASSTVKSNIGGKVNYPWIENTCAIRMSRTLNYNAFELPHNDSSLKTISGADGKWYSFRVAELKDWLIANAGSPQFDLVKAAGTTFDKRILKNVKGIIVFEIKFTDATGHFDLWDGQAFSSERKDPGNFRYWADASRISLWEAS